MSQLPSNVPSFRRAMLLQTAFAVLVLFVAAIAVLNAQPQWQSAACFVLVTVCSTVALRSSLTQKHSEHNWHAIPERSQAATGAGYERRASVSRTSDVMWKELADTGSLQELLDAADESVCSAAGNEASSQLRKIVETISDGIAVTDLSDHAVFLNSACASLLDTSVSDVLTGDRSFRDWLTNWSESAEDAAVLSESDAATPLAFELLRGTATEDGVLRLIRTPIRGDDSRLLWQLRDVTQERLADEMRDCFVSSATHELRTPLANIRAYAETLSLQDDLDPEQQKGFLNTITSEAKRLGRVIDDLLNVGRMQAGGLTLDRHETQMSRLAQEVHDIVQPLVQQSGHQFDLIVPPRLSELIVDKDKLASAIVNLLGNAIKYTEDGGRIRMELEETNTELRFHVDDSGVGISEEELPFVFDRFFRSADARVREVSGSGLGLAYAYDVARLHGGRIDVKSELNRGSRFSLILPVHSLSAASSTVGARKTSQSIA